MKALIATVTQLAGSLRGRVLRIGCWWNGHSLTNTYEDWCCTRCEQNLSYDEVASEGARYRIMGWRHRLKEWWRCRDCGRYCGRHDNKVDHVPF